MEISNFHEEGKRPKVLYNEGKSSKTVLCSGVPYEQNHTKKVIKGDVTFQTLENVFEHALHVHKDNQKSFGKLLKQEVVVQVHSSPITTT